MRTEETYHNANGNPEHDAHQHHANNEQWQYSTRDMKKDDDGERYDVYLYHGGERPDEVYLSMSMNEALELVCRAEHSAIVDKNGNNIDLLP
jgi:alpha-tubulin suppressor-like RCC1 family protein